MSSIARIGIRRLSRNFAVAGNSNLLHTSAPAAEVATVDGRRASIRGQWANADLKKGDRIKVEIQFKIKVEMLLKSR